MRRLLLPFFVILLSFIPLSIQAQSTPTSNTDGMMGFGRAVEVAGGAVFIGEPANAHQPGMVYIYRRTEGEWSQKTSISASDGEIGDGFGSSLASDGDRVLVGAPGLGNELGAAYLFKKAGDGSWTQTARIAMSDTSSEGGLGASVALRGNLAFVGAPGERAGAGAVYVFKRKAAGSWVQQKRIANPDTSQGFSFGSALAVKGNRLLIGAPRQKGGAVHVYTSDKKGEWTRETTLASGQVDNDGRFGATLAQRSNQILVGAPRHAAGSGAVFVFERDPDSGKWQPDGRLVAYDSGPRYHFGSSVAYVGKDAWIGAPRADNGKGAIYQFRRKPGAQEWAGVTKLGGPDRKQGDRFAGTLAIDGNIAVAGLVGADYGAGTAAIMERDRKTGEWSVKTTVLSKSSPVLDPITGNRVECRNGKAAIFGCNNVDLLSFMPIGKIGGDRGVRLNDIWGWTDPKTGKEYALVGRMDGTSFVDVSNPTKPVYVGTLPKPDSAQASIWRDIKVYKNHAYVVADNAGKHGMQVVDLTDLRNYEGTPLTLKEVAHYGQIHSAHNIVINKDTGFAYAVGSSGGGKTCGGGLHMINIQNPANPEFAGCFSDPSTGRSGTGYTHDAQCVTYHGPDKEYKGHEICIGANETAISIADVTNKKNPKAISTASYPDYGYVHQGWLTENHRYFFQNDELDELTGKVDSTRTLIWDLSDLDDPQFVREFYFDNPASDHNLYIKGDTMYQSNYVSGLQVVDVSNPEKPKKIGFFDTEPFGEDKAGFAGTWSNYPFFKSGIVIMTSSQEGLFVLDVEK